MATNGSVAPQLISYMAQAAITPLPGPVPQKTKHHILDTIADMVSGTTIKPGQMALGYVGELGGKSEAQVVGSSIVTSAVNAALANGMLAHADETDDSNGSAGIHPGCAVVSAALAMAERENSSGNDFTRAVALGYDISSRTTKALGREAMRARKHLPFSIGGTIRLRYQPLALESLQSRARDTLGEELLQKVGFHLISRYLMNE